MNDSPDELLARALPMLERLGDFIGNGELDPARENSHGVRCDLILDVKRHLGLLGQASDVTHVLVTGDLVTGFTFIGPITPNDPILDEYVDTELRDQHWAYIELTSLPDAVAEAADGDHSSTGDGCTCGWTCDEDGDVYAQAYLDHLQR